MAVGLLWKKGTKPKMRAPRALPGKKDGSATRKTRNAFSIPEDLVRSLYLERGKSMKDIALYLDCSVHKVSYAMERCGINARSRGEAMYVKRNPEGDPFAFKEPATVEEGILFGMGLGLYWGEGTKADKVSLRLGNTDPNLIEKFVEFLETIFAIRREHLRFGLQIFTDIDPAVAMDFWAKTIKINKHQFYKVTVTKSRGRGTCRKKVPYGVLTVYYHNKKLRDLLVSKLPL